MERGESCEPAGGYQYSGRRGCIAMADLAILLAVHSTHCHALSQASDSGAKTVRREDAQLDHPYLACMARWLDFRHPRNVRCNWTRRVSDTGSDRAAVDHCSRTAAYPCSISVPCLCGRLACHYTICTKYMGDNMESRWLARGTVASVRGMDAAGLLVLVALLHAAEAVLIRKQAARMAGPMFMESKRGRVVGAYRMQSMWPVPLLLLFPAGEGAALPWTPLFGGELWQHGWSLIAFPIVIGFSELTFTKLPQQKAALSSTRLFAYASLLLAISLAAAWWAPLVPVAAIAAIGMHEGLIWLSRREEAEHSPVFTQDAGGLRILAVLPNSPAAELGIMQGEVIVKVNGVKVRTKEELHQALRMNSAFCKLEVNNLSGEVRFLQRAIYAGDHHQLGVLLAPDDRVEYVAVTRAPSLFSYLLVPWTRSKRGAKRKLREQAESDVQSADNMGEAAKTSNASMPADVDNRA